MAQTEKKISYAESDINHVIAILRYLSGYLDAKLQTGQAAKIDEALKVLTKDK